MATDYSSKAMIALVPSAQDAQRLAILGGLPEHQLHLTLIFLGDVENYSEDLQQELITRLIVSLRDSQPITGDVFSIDFFNPTAANGCIVLGVSGDNLQLYQEAIQVQTHFLGDIVPLQHKPWVPHVTLGYIDDLGLDRNNLVISDELLSRLGPIVFDKLVVKFGDYPTYIALDELVGEEEDEDMTTNMNFLVDLSNGTNLSEGNSDTTKWVHALPIGNYNHPQYGKIVITAERVKRFMESVIKKVRGIDPNINYDHNKSGPAAGWIKDAETRNDGLWLLVEWVSDAAQAISEKKYRYFSAEYADEWEDAEGNSFEDVIVGGALTNRPFMKNLVPINLSEATYGQAFELVSAITGKDVESLKGGEMAELSEDALNKIIEGVAAKLQNTNVGSKKDEGNTEDGKGDKLPNVDLAEISELKELAESNPLVQALMNKVQEQGVNIVSTQKELSEARITRQLAEFDKSKLVLTPVAKKLVYKILSDMPEAQHNDFWELMTHMRKSQSFLVDLSERAGVAVKYGVDRSPAKRFNELVNKEMANNNTNYADAVTNVAAANPELYDEYRQESFSFRTN